MVAPTVPQNVNAEPANSGEDVEVTWDAPSNWGGDQGGYRIYRRGLPEGTDTQIADVADTETSYTDSGTGGNGLYPIYHVVAYNVDGDSPDSDKDGAVISLHDTTNLTGDSPSRGEVRAQWDSTLGNGHYRSEAINPIDLSGVEIGGGEQYTNIHTSGDYTVSTEAEINTALDSATSGEVVYIEGSADIDLDGHIVVPSGVTLASNRGNGGADGATLRGYDSEPAPIEVHGILEGVEVVGPSPDYLELDDRYEFGSARGIECFDDAEIANCHVHHFTDGGITAENVELVEIHHCEISDHPVEGIGYGIRATSSGTGANRVTIEYCYLHTCRHEIAAHGGDGYVARYNVFGKDKFENETSNLMQSDIDEHDAGSIHEVYENLFLETGHDAIGWDEDVDSTSTIEDNWFWHESESDALAQSTIDGVDAANITGNHYGLSNPPNTVGNPQVTDLWSERDTGGFGARTIDCDGGYIDVPNSPELNITGDLSVSMWFNPDNITETFQTPFGKGILYGTDSTAGQYGIGLVGDSVRWQLYDGDTKSGAEAGIGSANTWYHVVGTFDSSTGDQSLYINDSLRTTANAIDDPINTETGNLSIGRDPERGSDFYFNGQINDVRLYNKTLTAAEVSNLFSGVNVTDSLVGYWPIHTDDASTVYDYTENQNHGTVNNTAPKSLDDAGDSYLNDFSTTEQTFDDGDISAIDGTEYDIRVRTESPFAHGTWKLTSPPSQLPSPDTPTLNVLSSSEIDVSWAFNDNYTGGYVKIHRSKSSSNTGELVEKLEPGTTSYSDDGLDPGTPYWYTVIRYSDYTSSQNQSASVAGNRTDLAALTDLSVDNANESGIVSDDVAELSWVDPNGLVDTNVVELSTDEGGSWTEEESIGIAFGADPERSYTTDELLEGTEYDVRVIVRYSTEEVITE